MTAHAIIGRFGANDSSPVTTLSYTQHHNINLVNAQKRIDFGITQAMEDLSTFGVRPSEVGVDLMVLAALIHAADTRVLRSEAQDSWTRELAVIVPVSNPELWSASASLISEMLQFLTGDLWTISFVSRILGFENTTFKEPKTKKNVSFDVMSLFSGGLDSLIGAIDLLQQKKIPLLISHSGDGTTNTAQVECFGAIKKNYNEIERLRIWLAVAKKAFGGGKSETTTRGRSFLFFSLAAFATSGIDHPISIHVPENGLISLNVPLDPLRLGSFSTRTTHPFYITAWNKLLRQIGLNSSLENPYQYLTKGEMIARCKNKELLLSLLPSSMSCSSPNKFRYRGLPPRHCGFCVPCIIRRAAIAASVEHDPTPYVLSDLHSRNLSTLQAEGRQIRSFQISASRVSQNENLAKILIHKTGPLTHTQMNLDELTKVYCRGLSEVSSFLTGVNTIPS